MSVACSLLKDFLLSSSRKDAVKGEDTVAWQLARNVSGACFINFGLQAGERMEKIFLVSSYIHSK